MWGGGGNRAVLGFLARLFVALSGQYEGVHFAFSIILTFMLSACFSVCGDQE
jgi:hypothetical protein